MLFTADCLQTKNHTKAYPICSLFGESLQSAFQFCYKASPQNQHMYKYFLNSSLTFEIST